MRLSRFACTHNVTAVVERLQCYNYTISVCGIPQNAAHLLRCTEVGDWKGRSREEMLQDEEWLSAVYEMLEKNREER